MKKLITRNIIQIDLNKNPTKTVKCLLRLKEYEDTNLTPKEIIELQNKLENYKQLIQTYEKIISDAVEKSVNKNDKIQQDIQQTAINLINKVDTMTKEETNKTFDELMKQLNPKNFKNNFNTRP